MKFFKEANIANTEEKVESREKADSNKELKLSLKPRDEAIMSDMQKEYLREETEEFPPVQDGEINIQAIYAYEDGEKLEVKAFIRNGLSTTINLDKVPLIIVNSKNEVLASQVFELKEEIGDVPEHSQRPFKVYFDKENVFAEDIPSQDWKLIFDSAIKAVNYAEIEYEGYPRGVDETGKIVLDNFLASLPPVEIGQVSVSNFNIAMEKQGELLVTIVIRNGAKQDITIEKLPITIRDEKDTVLLSGIFNLEGIVINPNKARVQTLAFPTGIELQHDLDLSSFKLTFELGQ